MDQSSQKQTFHGFNNGHSCSENNSAFRSGEGTEQTKLKARAYINPQIINYEYLKRSLGQSFLPKPNKIHFNPNFKRSEINVLQKGNDMQLPSRHEEFSTRLNAVDKDKNTLGSIPTKNCENTHFTKSAFQYRVINNSRSNHYGNQSQYSWSNKKKSAFNKQLQTMSEMGFTKLNKQWKINKNKLENVNYLKLNISKNAPKGPDLFSKLQEKKIPLKYLSKTKIINLNSKKLIKNTSSKCKANVKQMKLFSPNKMCMNSSKFVYNKNKSIQGLALVIKNKYKYCKIANHSKTSRFKIDKRRKDSESFNRKQIMNKTKDIRKLFPMSTYSKTKYFNSNVYLNSQYNVDSVHRNSLLWRKNQSQENVIPSKTRLYPNKRIVKIGGIMYKSTCNKLTLAKGTNKEKTVNKNHIVYVRGEKFLLDKNGKTLIRQSNNVESDKVSTIFKRLDIGGVTYLQKSPNVLIRTNVHHARHIVNHAKQKSIATLCHLRKRSSLPCMIFNKFGKCIRHNKGLCMYKHDPKNIAICKKFLKGNCVDNTCLLSHETVKEKMATCHFFLNECCNRENCPFLHVKLNNNADICENFLHGFCDLGQNCPKRHLFQCPKYDKSGKCTMGSKCLYPHVKKKIAPKSCQAGEKSNALNENLQSCIKKFSAVSKIPKEKKIKRPILKLKDGQTSASAKKVKKCKRKSSSSSLGSDKITDQVECVPKRIKLDKLPSFIPLK